MLEGRLNVIEACDKAESIVIHAREMNRLHGRAVRYLGEGGLRMRILNMATDAFEDESLKEEVFAGDESLLSFFCGVWIQFLLVEIAGVKKERLRSVAEKVYASIQEAKALH